MGRPLQLPGFLSSQGSHWRMLTAGKVGQGFPSALCCWALKILLACFWLNFVETGSKGCFSEPSCPAEQCVFFWQDLKKKSSWQNNWLVWKWFKMVFRQYEEGKHLLGWAWSGCRWSLSTSFHLGVFVGIGPRGSPGRAHPLLHCQRGSPSPAGLFGLLPLFHQTGFLTN